MTVNFFLQNLINALQWGSFYALIALGYSMVYSILMLFNFAHGDIFMVGAYIGLGVSIGLLSLFGTGAAAVLPGWVLLVMTLLISMFLTAFVGIIVERVGYRPLREAPRASAAITGLMIGIILETSNILFLGGSRLKFPQLDRIDHLQHRWCVRDQQEDHDRSGFHRTDAGPAPVYQPNQVGHGHAGHGLRLRGGSPGGGAHEHHCRHDVCHRFGPGCRRRHSISAWPIRCWTLTWGSASGGKPLWRPSSAAVDPSWALASPASCWALSKS